ncbi:unnamed protein product [Sphagnum troendelagicum]|uniref:Uncharacterized protein n=1 Tax=Sphagnum troendelagicum TaxID=128251 RepID=A0ABP0TIB7_9BRYO
MTPCARTNVPKIEEIRRGSAVCAAVATLVRTRSALHEQPSCVRARSITFVFRCGIQGLVCSLEARFSLSPRRITVLSVALSAGSHISDVRRQQKDNQML